MKLKLQNKLLLPIVTTLLFFIGASAFIFAHILVRQLEEHSIDLLRAGNTAIVKHISSSMANYKANLRSVAAMPPLRQAADICAAGGELNASAMTSTL